MGQGYHGLLIFISRQSFPHICGRQGDKKKGRHSADAAAVAGAFADKNEVSRLVPAQFFYFSVKFCFLPGDG